MTAEKIIDLNTRNAAILELIESDGEYNEEVISALILAVSQPDEVENTNSFATLITEINDARFIDALIEQISTDKLGDSTWLADYMYALIGLLEEEDEYYEVSDHFVHQLGKFLLNTGGGEISWKAGDVLMRIENPVSKEYVVKGVSDIKLFHLTRIACMSAIVNQFTDEAEFILQRLELDPNKDVRDSAISALAYLAQEQR